jgi:hypothetical protein
MARALAVCLFLLGVPLAVVAIPLFAIGLVLFSSDTYVGALDRSQALQRLPDAAATQLYLSLHYEGQEQADAAESVPGGAPAALAALDEAQLQALMRDLLAPEDLRPAVDGFFRSFFAATNGSTDPVVIPLAPLKSRLAGGAAAKTYFALLSAQPTCTEAETQVVIARSKTDVPACRPTDAVIAQIRPDVEATLNGVVAQMPDQQSMAESLSPETLAALQTLRRVMLYAPIVPLGLFLLAAVLTGTRGRAILRAWGVLFALLGGLVFAATFNIPAQFEQRWTENVAEIPPYWAPSLVALLHDVLREMVAAVTNGLVFVSGLVGLIGLALIAFVKRSVTEPEAAPALAN